MSDYIEVDGLRIGPNRYRYLVEQNKELTKRIADLEAEISGLEAAADSLHLDIMSQQYEEQE